MCTEQNKLAQSAMMLVFVTLCACMRWLCVVHTVRMNVRLWRYERHSTLIAASCGTNSPYIFHIHQSIWFIMLNVFASEYHTFTYCSRAAPSTLHSLGLKVLVVLLLFVEVEVARNHAHTITTGIR